MAKPLLLLCKYGMFTAVIHLSESMRYDDLMHHVCNKWKNLVVIMVYLTYELPSHPKCLLDSDLDLLIHVGLFNVNEKSGCICIKISRIKGR